MQSVYRISEGAGLALTTGRYFTPSGRMIQRPWDGTFDEYLTYTLRDQTGAAAPQSGGSEIHRRRPEGLRRRRDRAGQVLRRSDPGIQSDARSAARSIARGAFDNFAERYAAEGDTRLGAAAAGRQDAS